LEDFKNVAMGASTSLHFLAADTMDKCPVFTLYLTIFYSHNILLSEAYEML